MFHKITVNRGDLEVLGLIYSKWSSYRCGGVQMPDNTIYVELNKKNDITDKLKFRVIYGSIKFLFVKLKFE